MVDTLKKWRKRWLNCGDIENLFRLGLASIMSLGSSVMQ
jgi:hypothetical protein